MGHHDVLSAEPDPAAAAFSPDWVLLEWRNRASASLHTASFLLGGIRLDVESDDLPLLSDIATILGAPVSGDFPPARASFSARIRTHGGPPEWGHLRLAVAGEEPPSPQDLLLGLSSPDFPFELFPSPPSWTSLAFRGDSLPALCLRGEDCLFRLMPQWRAAVALLIFQRLMRIRKDAIFFHAASLAVFERGVLLVGPKGAGKSTTALALASRGHGLLGDEYAAYLPAGGTLVPFRRPVGIKPGPRARAVDAALARSSRSPEREGPFRIDAAALLGLPEAEPVPLRAVFFLKGFTPRPQLSRIPPGRDEVAQLQPTVTSLVTAPQSQRVFQMARLLSASAVFHLHSGDPDDTAAVVEDAVRTAWP